MHGGVPVAVPVFRKRVFYVLLMADAMLIVLHLLSQTLRFDGETLLYRHDLLNLDAEVGAATWWQQLQLAAGGTLCLLLAFLLRGPDGRRHRYWLALGTIVLWVSLDEGAQIHEGLTEPMQRLFDITDGVFRYAWVIPGFMAIAAFGVVFFRFWHRLPATPRRLMVIGAAAFVGGGLGFEMAAGAYPTEKGVDAWFTLLVAGEEGLEMLGASILILSVLSMIQVIQTGSGISFVVEDDLPSSDPVDFVPEIDARNMAASLQPQDGRTEASTPAPLSRDQPPSA